MADTTGAAGREAGTAAPMFACHKSPEGREEACAGWLAAVGYHHLGVRLAVVTGRLSPETLEPGPDWPDLHQSYEEMVEAKTGTPNSPAATPDPINEATDPSLQAIDPRLSATLAPHALDNPRDGACLHTAPRVTEALQEQGYEARTAAVAGWMDPSATILGFLHQVTLSGDTVLDGTARQFNPALPPAWIAPTSQYLRRLADATGMDHATVLPA